MTRSTRLSFALFTGAVIMACAPKSVSRWPDHLTAGELLQPGSQPRGGVRAVHPTGLTLTKRSEGWSARTYNDAAEYCTIGYGHLIKKAPCNGTEPPMFMAGLTEPQGEQLLVTDMTSAAYTVMTSVTVQLTDLQFASLTDFVFNVGSTNFRASTLLRVINGGQNDNVPTQFRRWVYAGGKPWPGLTVRREGEIELYFDGLPHPRAISPPTDDVSPIDIRAGEKQAPLSNHRIRENWWPDLAAPPPACPHRRFDS